MKKRISFLWKSFSTSQNRIPKPSPKKVIFETTILIHAKRTKIVDALPHMRNLFKLDKKIKNKVLADVRTLWNWFRKLLWTHQN